MDVASDTPQQMQQPSTAAHDAAHTTSNSTSGSPSFTATKPLLPPPSTPLHHGVSASATPISSSSVMKSPPQPLISSLGGMEYYHLTSPSSRLFHQSHQLTPSLSAAYCPSSAPPLSLPPSHYHYYDGASYADDSVVSSVDDYALLSSVHSTTSDERVSHFDRHEQQGSKLLVHGKYEGAAADTSQLLNFTPHLQPAPAPSQVEYEEAYASESSVASSSAAASPVFQPSSLSPLSPTLAGQVSSSSSVHTDLITHAQSNPPSPCDDHSPAPHATPASIHPQLPHDITATYTNHPSAASIFYEPHTSPQPPTQPRSLLPPVALSVAPIAPFSLLSHSMYPVVPLAPSDSVCSAPFLPPVTGSPFPFSPPVPLGQTANGGSGMAAADYVAASYSKLKAAAATMVQTRPNAPSNWMGAKLQLPATKKAASKAAKAKKSAGSKKERKRKRDESDSDSDSDSSDSSSDSSSESDSDDSCTSSARRRTSGFSSTPRRKPLSKKERNKVSASAYRKRKKAHIVALHGVADTLKTTVAQQSDMIDSITNENRVLREQVSFVHKLFGSSASFLVPQKDKVVASEKEVVGAPPPVAQPASPKMVAAVPAPSAVAPIATVNAAGQVTVLSPEAEKLDLSALLLKPVQQEPEVTVKKEFEEKPQQEQQATAATAAATIPSSVSSAQRASIFLFVIFTCFLLFNPNSLHAPLSDTAFSQLTASFLNHQYNGGIDIPFATFTSSTLPTSPSPLSFLSSFTSASAASLLSPDAVVRQFLEGGLGDESFFGEVLERTLCAAGAAGGGGGGAVGHHAAGWRYVDAAAQEAAGGSGNGEWRRADGDWREGGESGDGGGSRKWTGRGADGRRASGHSMKRARHGRSFPCGVA